MGPLPIEMTAALLLIQILGLAPVVSALKTPTRRFFGSFGDSFSDSFCFNSRYNSRTKGDQCENNCCWGQSCGDEGECEKAFIIAMCMGAFILVCICGAIAFCVCKKKCCFNNRGDSQSVIAMQPAR